MEFLRSDWYSIVFDSLLKHYDFSRSFSVHSRAFWQHSLSESDSRLKCILESKWFGKWKSFQHGHRITIKRRSHIFSFHHYIVWFLCVERDSLSCWASLCLWKIAALDLMSRYKMTFSGVYWHVWSYIFMQDRLILIYLSFRLQARFGL